MRQHKSQSELAGSIDALRDIAVEIVGTLVDVERKRPRALWSGKRFLKKIINNQCAEQSCLAVGERTFALKIHQYNCALVHALSEVDDMLALTDNRAHQRCIKKFKQTTIRAAQLLVELLRSQCVVPLPH